MTERALKRAFECLQSIGESLVLVGGTAHRLFPLHELGTSPGFDLLTTEDVDIAAALELELDGGQDLLDRLLQAGFEEEVSGAQSPAYRYVLPSDEGAYLQFIAPRKGSGTTRGGGKNLSLRFSGLRAEKLAHVEILISHPWRVTVESSGTELSLQVVNPVAFLLQKLLLLPNRGRKKGKDLLYVFDTLTIFADALDELGEAASDLVESPSRNASKKIRSTMSRYCFEESATSRDAAAIAFGQRANAPDSAQVVAACRIGLKRVLGGLVQGL